MEDEDKVTNIVHIVEFAVQIGRVGSRDCCCLLLWYHFKLRNILRCVCELKENSSVAGENMMIWMKE